jgi:ABC-type nitrate/sulfonate/bicarbonate transport system ATPase subunit
LRTSLSLALIVVAIAEMGGVYERSTSLWWSAGLGYRLFRSYDIARDDQLLGIIVLFAVLGIFSDACFSALWSLGAFVRFGVQQRRARKAAARFGNAGVVFGPLQPAAPAEVGLEAISAAYDGRTVISGLSLKVSPGATLSILGPSGCGKTTLLRAIGHLLDEELVVTGDVKIAGEMQRVPGVWMGIVLQDSPVFDYMTVWDNVTFGSLASEHTAWQLLVEFGLAPFASTRAGSLSGGQRQRLAVATAIANRPKVLMLDEPFGALDAITRRQLQTFYRDHVRGKVTAVFVTHDLTEALLVSDSIVIGVDADRKTLQVDRTDSLSPEWEFSPRFAQMKRIALEELERISTNATGASQDASHNKGGRDTLSH